MSLQFAPILKNFGNLAAGVDGTTVESGNMPARPGPVKE
jgi:hypothetical protein